MRRSFPLSSVTPKKHFKIFKAIKIMLMDQEIPVYLFQVISLQLSNFTEEIKLKFEQ
jgi:hypothetical protein